MRYDLIPKSSPAPLFFVACHSMKGRDGLSPLLVVIRLDLLLWLLRGRGIFFLICKTLPSLSYVEEDAALFFAVYPRSGL
jgi:hypothetical protein